MTTAADYGDLVVDTRLLFDDQGVPKDVVSVVDLDRTSEAAEWDAGSRVQVGVARAPLTPAGEAALSRMACTLVPTSADAATRCRPEVVAVPDVDAALAGIVARSGRAPRATFALDGLLRVTCVTDPEAGVVAESFTYSTLLGGPEFRAWRAANPPRAVPVAAGAPVRLDREGDVLRVVLDRAHRRNAFAADLRAGLVDALRLVELDPSIERVVLSGAGRCFSSGGDLDEFGSATDLAAAHAVRLDQSAGLAVHRVRDRVEARLHGTCIGAGVEVPAFAARVVADRGTTFWLPELGMGLVPGAGGTVSVSARIGRWRTGYLVLSAASIDAPTALEWGLVDEVL